MAKEIERKYLVDESKWPKNGKQVKMKQAYLLTRPNIVIRVRINEYSAYLTIKGKPEGISRDEFEYEIPINDALQLMEMRTGAIVSKTRYIEYIDNKKWETDVFDDENQGLIVAEIELENENESVTLPPWITHEVSTDERYYNFNLSKNPFTKWKQ
jgi:adenylate cyclase